MLGSILAIACGRHPLRMRTNSLVTFKVEKTIFRKLLATQIKRVFFYNIKLIFKI